MNDIFDEMILNDSFYVENDDVWFVSRIENRLYHGKLSSRQFEFIEDIPTEKPYDFRVNPFCIKYDRFIICLPDRGMYIWVYDVGNKELKKIEIQNSDAVRLGMGSFWLSNNTLWVWSSGLRQILEIGLIEENTIKYYAISDDLEDDFAVQAIKADENICLFSFKHKILYEFNLKAKNVKKNYITQLGNGISTICYNKGFFWFSGIDKCIYKWNQRTNEVDCCLNFPKEFKVDGIGIKPIFGRSICVNGYICFVPWNFPQTISNSILFVDENDYKMKTLQIYDTYDDGKGTYTVEYILKNRYIGIQYERNDYISEIDTENFEIKKMSMKFSADNHAVFLKKRIKKEGVLKETFRSDLQTFLML